jgi:hypothetical protein
VASSSPIFENARDIGWCVIGLRAGTARTPVDDCVGRALDEREGRAPHHFSQPNDRVHSGTVCRASLGIFVEHRHTSSYSVNSLRSGLITSS